jgi:DNA-binding NtrC family response regulator
MDGNELAIRIKKLFPDVMTLFISGYTANIITHNDILADTTSFLPKPFSINDLSQTIHNMLSSRQDVPSD